MKNDLIGVIKHLLICLFHPAQDTGYHILLLNAMIIKELSGVKSIKLCLFKQEKYNKIY